MSFNNGAFKGLPVSVKYTNPIPKKLAYPQPERQLCESLHCVYFLCPIKLQTFCFKLIFVCRQHEAGRQTPAIKHAENPLTQMKRNCAKIQIRRQFLNYRCNPCKSIFLNPGDFLVKTPENNCIRTFSAILHCHIPEIKAQISTINNVHFPLSNQKSSNPNASLQFVLRSMNWKFGEVFILRMS